MVEQHKASEQKLAIRSLLFLSPFLCLVVALALLAFMGPPTFDPFLLFVALFPALGFGWWFGHRPLATLKKANRITLQTAIESYRSDVK